MWLDAALAYLHYFAIIVLFSFLTVQAMLLRTPPDAGVVRLLGRADLWAAAAAGATLITGFLRAGFGAKGGDFYFNAWPIYVKIALFVPEVKKPTEPDGIVESVAVKTRSFSTYTLNVSPVTSTEMAKEIAGNLNCVLVSSGVS